MMRRALIAVLLLGAMASSAAAQEAAVTLPVMDLFAMPDSSAGTGTGRAHVVRPVTPKRGAVIGGVIGAVAGVLFGAYYAYALCDAAECHAISSDTWKAGLFFGGLGAAGGAAVGALFGWVDED